MLQPAYMRSGSDTSFPSATDSLNNSIHITGLREKRLYAMIGYLVLLSIVALFLLIMNIMLIVSLQMSQHGMQFLRFHNVFNPKTKEIEKVVQFDGNNIDLGTVVTNGQVSGYKDKELYIYGSRVLLSAAESGTHLTIEENGCRFENTQHFQIISTETLKPLFSAQHPAITIDKHIKKLSTNKIVTNKIRSPIDESLKVDVENLSIRGNEGIRMEANAVKFFGFTSINFNTSSDGSIRLNGRMKLDTSSRGLPLSASPALSASIDAFRVCICGGTQKLFLTPGNKPCESSNAICI